MSVSVPLLEQGLSIERACEAVVRQLMYEMPLVDELVVLIHGGSGDVVPDVADVRVVDVDDVMPEVPQAPGRGDTLWRGLSLLRGDIAVWPSADRPEIDPSEVLALMAPLLMEDAIGFVKGCHEPCEEFEVKIDGVVYRAGGMRTTELAARPLMNLLFPELGGFVQPLDRAFASRMSVLRRLPFFSGCSVDVAILIDAFDVVGLEGMAQVHLGPESRNQLPIEELGARSHAIVRAILQRAHERRRAKVPTSIAMRPLMVPVDSGVEPVRIQEVERPPMEVVPPYLEALRSSAASVEVAQRDHPAGAGRTSDEGTAPVVPIGRLARTDRGVAGEEARCGFTIDRAGSL